MGDDLKRAVDHLEGADSHAIRARLAHAFSSRARDEWSAELDGTCDRVAPVPSLDEAPQEAHGASRGVVEFVDGDCAPPAPRLDHVAVPGAAGTSR